MTERLQIELPDSFRESDALLSNIQNQRKQRFGSNWFFQFIPNFGLDEPEDFLTNQQRQELSRLGISGAHAGGVFPSMGLRRIEKELINLAPSYQRKIDEIDLNGQVQDFYASRQQQQRLEAEKQLAQIGLENQKQLYGLQSDQAVKMADRDYDRASRLEQQRFENNRALTQEQTYLLNRQKQKDNIMGLVMGLIR